MGVGPNLGLSGPKYYSQRGLGSPQSQFVTTRHFSVHLDPRVDLESQSRTTFTYVHELKIILNLIGETSLFYLKLYMINWNINLIKIMKVYSVSNRLFVFILKVVVGKGCFLLFLKTVSFCKFLINSRWINVSIH